jgi:hypothetical protein
VRPANFAGHRYERVCATSLRAFCLAQPSKIQLNPRTQDLISPECALPSRIVKEQSSVWLCTRCRTHTAKPCPTQSTGAARITYCPPPPTLAADRGGAGRDRTDGLLLAKQALSQLSYSPVAALSRHPRLAFAAPCGRRRDPVARRRSAAANWWVWMDSNHRPPPYQDGALTN